MGQRTEQYTEWECDYCGVVLDSRTNGPGGLPAGWRSVTPGYSDHMDTFCSWVCVAGKANEYVEADAQRATERAARKVKGK